MPKKIILFLFLLLVFGVGLSQLLSLPKAGAPPDGIPENQVPSNLDPLAFLKGWKRPEGPARVGVQVGHWKSSEVPDELKNLRQNTGGSGGDSTEVEVNLAIAQELKTRLEKKGVTVDLLPATVPEKYWADVFVAIHADGSTDSSKSGFKIAGPWRDYTGKSARLIDLLETQYSDATGLEIDPNITRNMRGYYAFAWWRYDHAIHPMATGVIVETGFLTNRSDQKLLINSPEVPAQALSEGLVTYLNEEGLLE
jgi:hypothetical protein